MITHSDWITPEEVKEIEQTVLVKEAYELGIPTKWPTPFKGLTSKYSCYNWLDDFEFLIPKLQTILKSTHVVQCWANVLRQGEGVPRHKHSRELSGNFNTGFLFPKFSNFFSLSFFFKSLAVGEAESIIFNLPE